MQSITTDQERSALSCVYAALLPLVEMSPTPMSLSMALTFLTVATREGKTIKDIYKITGLTQPATSRMLMDLSRRNKFGGAGLGLIEQRVDDHDPRYMRNYLSEPGRALVRKMVGDPPRTPGSRVDGRRMSRNRKASIQGQFAPHRLEMLTSAAYRALSLSGHRVLARIEIDAAWRLRERQAAGKVR
jgi:DNA-binding MarR family transcriptional regulator